MSKLKFLYRRTCRIRFFWNSLPRTIAGTNKMTDNRAISGFKLKSVAVSAFLFMFLFVQAAPLKAMPIFFVGIGNPTAGDPDMKAVDTLDKTLKKIAKALGQEYKPTIIKATVTATKTEEVGGTAIINALNQVKAKAKEGDLVVFYYIGHGNRTDAPPGKEDKTDSTDKAKTKGDEWIGKTSDKLTDDQLATVLGSINPSVPKVVIVDACFSGGMINGADDINKSSMLNLAYMLSVPEADIDQGLYEYPAWLEEAIEKNTHYKGDKNEDGSVTIGEWLDYAHQKRIAKGQGGTWGWTSWTGSQPPTDYVIIPEPTTLVLLGLGGLALLSRRKG